MHLRQKNLKSNGANPITMRQLESLTRLTQARAKAEMRTICSRRDALDVIEIMKASMVDYGDDEFALLDQSSLNSSGSSSSKSSLIKQFVLTLQRISDDKKSDLFNFDEIKALYEVRFIF